MDYYFKSTNVKFLGFHTRINICVIERTDKIKINEICVHLKLTTFLLINNKIKEPN